MVALAGPKYSKAQRELFFDLLDRGGSVRAAAAAAGVHPGAAYTWLRKNGLVMRRETPRVYSEQEKAEFFRLLAERGNVSAVARELGFTRVTCYKWAHQAGIFTSQTRRVPPRRQEFLRLRAEGLTRAQAAQRVGADKRSAADWDKGITIIHRGRVYPDGRVVRYPEPILADVNSPRTATVLGGKIDLERVERVIHPRYLRLVEREQLRDLHRSGISIRGIAAELGRSPSTISRELRRNTISVRGYLPHSAHRASVARRLRPRNPKLSANAQLREYVQNKLAKKWSPQQISNRLVIDFPTDPRMRICTETIYQGIYVHARSELKRELGRQLRRGRLRRKPRRDSAARRPRFVEPMTLITTRPPEVESRTVPGHWEGDLVIGATIARPSRHWSNDPAASSCSATSGRTAAPTHCVTVSSPSSRSCLPRCGAPSPGTRAVKWPNTARSAPPPIWPSTSANQDLHGSAAATKTRMAYWNGPRKLDLGIKPYAATEVWARYSSVLR